MKTVSDYYKRMIEDGDTCVYRFVLQDPTGVEYDVTSYVLSPGTIDEDAEDEHLNVGGGDLQIELDNRTGYFVGAHARNGILDFYEGPGDWRLKVHAAMRTATDDPVIWYGILSNNWQRTDGGARVIVDAYSPSSHAKRVSAWDGDRSRKYLFNTPIAQVAELMGAKVDTHGDLTYDVDIPALEGSNKHFQVFDSLITNDDDRRAGPSTFLFLRYNSGVARFWLNITGRHGRSYIVDWDLTAREPVAVETRPFSILDSSNMTEFQVFPADWLGTNSARRFWVVSHAGAVLIDPEHATTLAVVSAALPELGYPPHRYFSVGVDGTIYYAGRTYEHIYSAHPLEKFYQGRCFSVTVAGVVTERLKFVYGRYSTGIPAGYSYIGEAGVSGPANSPVVLFHSDNDKVAILNINERRITVHRISDGTSVHFSPINYPTGNWLTEQRHHLVAFSGASDDWWGFLTWGGQGHTSCVLLDQGLSGYGGALPDKAVFAQNPPKLGFDPTDGIGLLEAGHPENPTNEDQRINQIAGVTADVLVSASAFTMLWQHDSFGFGVRCYTITEVDYVPAFREDHFTALVSTELDMSWTGLTQGVRLDGYGGAPVPDEWYLLPVGHGPTSTPIEERRRIDILVRQDTTTPIVYRMELTGRKCWDVLTEALKAANCNVAFRWDDTAGAPVMVVRGRNVVDAVHGDEYAYADATVLRTWDHTYTGIVVVTALAQEFDEGDVDSPNANVLRVEGEYISPSFGRSLAVYDRQFFTVARQLFEKRLASRPHWELLDVVRVYTLDDLRTWRARIIGRQIELDSNAMRVKLLEV